MKKHGLSKTFVVSEFISIHACTKNVAQQWQIRRYSDGKRYWDSAL